MALYANLYGPETLDYPNGAHAANLLVEVRYAATELPALLYTDRTKTVLAPNPLHTDSLGNLAFWAEPGEYLIVFNSGDMHVSVPDHPDEPEAGGGGDFTQYVHTQAIAASTWIMNHGLGRKTHCTIFDDAGFEVEADVFAATLNQTSAIFPSPDTGSAVIS